MVAFMSVENRTDYCGYEGKTASHPFHDAPDSSVTVLVHLDRLRHNFHELQRACGVPIMPVLKADAYGHGVVRCAKALEAYAPLLGVGTVAEGSMLRDAGIATPILAMVGLICKEDARLAARDRIMPLAGTSEALKALNAAHSGSAPLPVALKFNTGMSRLGFSPDDVPAVIDLARGLPNIAPAAAISHLAAADESAGSSFTDRQIALFDDIAAGLKSAFPQMQFSLANSAGGLAYEKARHDFVRGGIALYGCNPLEGSGLECMSPNLQPVMEVFAPILQVRDISAGESVSYGCTFTAQTPMRIAVVAAGYAHGFLRALSGKGVVNIKGEQVPILGRICMQLCMADVSRIPYVQPGEPAFLIGGQEHPVSACAQAAAAGTIPYELFCLLGARNQRCFSE